MKASLTFKLPQEADEFYSASKGAEYRDAIGEVLSNLRSRLKYDNLTDEQYHMTETLQAELIHAIRVRGLEI